MEDKLVDTTNVFVKYLPANVEDQALRRMFAPFGEIVSAKVMIDPFTFNSLGFGFVKFNTQEEANGAIHNMTGRRLGKKTLMCKLSYYSTITHPSCNLYVKPLPRDFTEENLLDIFSKFGKIRAVKMVRDSSKQKDAIGLVRCEEVEIAQNAIFGLNGRMIASGWPPVMGKRVKKVAIEKCMDKP
eukprot:Phypoly_transcript_10022.p1 GENE.Phypoly_transcript_10022~~Phypoly_transcript_10022.p1  ORF type:complete len:205 (+),score=34.00 Phypoly_transcript_10022:62-616(+)